MAARGCETVSTGSALLSSGEGKLGGGRLRLQLGFSYQASDRPTALCTMTEEFFAWFVPCPSRSQPGHGPHTQISRRLLRFLTQARRGAEAELGSMNFLSFLTAHAFLESLPSFHTFLTLLNLHFFHFSSHSAPSPRHHVLSFFLCLESVTQSCPTLCDPLDCSPPGSSVHRLLQARILGWVTIPFSRDLPDPRIKPGSPALQAVS